MARHCFFSFHYKPDCSRVAQVRNIGSIDGNVPAHDNEWESITSAGDSAIKNWVAEQMQGKSCTIVLVGSNTAKRKWIDYEIIESWKKSMGIVGIYIHGLKDLQGLTSQKGQNPFSHIHFENSTRKLSDVVKCYDPPGYSSNERYSWIAQNLANIVEEAIKIRKSN